MLRLLKKSFRSVFRSVGYDIVRRPGRRALADCKTICGSFPPWEENFSIGRRENYFIHDGYRHRSAPLYFDETSNEDEWQFEVYKFAREICERERLNSVCDIGCGSGFKLMSFFDNFATVGMDLPATCRHLRRRWPNRRWEEADFTRHPPSADLVIAADVIEHLVNPDDLLLFIQRIEPRWAVISTPDRNLLRLGTHNGPPENVCHVREWSMTQFHKYVEQFFHIEQHFISNAAQATQCVLCRPSGE